MKPKSVENYTGMESEEPFGDEMPNFDICGTVFKELFKDIDVLDVDVKTETAASSENSGRKSTENEVLLPPQGFGPDGQTDPRRHPRGPRV